MTNRKLKRKHLFEKYFCNNVEVFSVTFDKFNVSMLNAHINFFFKNRTDSKLLNGIVYVKTKAQIVTQLRLVMVRRDSQTDY